MNQINKSVKNKVEFISNEKTSFILTIISSTDLFLINMTQKFGRLGIALEKLKNLKFSWLATLEYNKSSILKNIFFNKNFIYVFLKILYYL